MKETFQITPEGKAELEKEVEQLKGRRGEIAEKIAEARDFGDLSENAEYDAAREEQGIVETRIAVIENFLQNEKIIKTTWSNEVHLGSRVTLEANGKQVTYTLVGPVEADPLSGKISNESPIGKVILGKRIGDTATITTPKGELTYTITELQ